MDLETSADEKPEDVEHIGRDVRCARILWNPDECGEVRPGFGQKRTGRHGENRAEHKSSGGSNRDKSLRSGELIPVEMSGRPLDAA